MGADLRALANEASSIAIKRIIITIEQQHNNALKTEKQDAMPDKPDEPRSEDLLLSTEQLQHLFITMNDFELALKKVQPSAKREGYIVVVLLLFLL